MPMSRRMFSACGPERRLAAIAAQLALDEVPVEVEEGEPARLEPSASASPNRPCSERFVIGAAAEPGDDVVDDRPAARTARAARSGRRSRRRRPRTPSRARRRASRRASAGADLLERVTAGSSVTPSGADPDALLAQLVDDVLDRAEHRAERDDDRLGVARSGSRRTRPPELAAERLRELAGDLAGSASSACICFACIRYLTSVNASGPTIAPIVTGSSGSSTWRGSNGGRNASTCSCDGTSTRSKACVRTKPSMQTITGSESSSASRNAWMCRSTRLLVGLGVELDPARVALRHRVAVVVPDVDRRADRAVGDRHDDRQAEAGGVVERLGHVEQALARGRGVGARAGGRGADRTPTSPRTPTRR